MKKLKLRKSPGPDMLHNEMLLHLGLEGKKVLLKLINKTWDTAGFRTGKQAEDELFRLSQKVIDGFQKKKNTTAVFVHLLQAYDRVWRKGLLWKMRELTLKEHIQDLRGRANKRLRLVKRLASISSGTDKNTLRQLYVGNVRSLIALQSISSKTNKDLLDREQSQAVHFISGGMHSTPTAACEIHTNIEPLGSEYMVERYKRSDKTHPNRQRIDTWKPTGRLKQKSVMDISTYLQEKHHLPNNIENLQHFCKEIPPHHRKYIANIRTQLIEETSKKHGDSIDIMITAQKTLDTYPEHWIHVYTDGSVFKGTINGGYGVRIQYPDKTKEELCESYESNCSN
ncbi:reverse transcriptase-like protein [Elysia marginata]|uniref:Reverse transcriptase-like protein n=1 Tax=Elysia marginata TaxID=1093978 RepID=A0AAV4HT00_9GAST|nr:reverse transcriptase-like protein [Elysia marginata]